MYSTYNYMAEFSILILKKYAGRKMLKLEGEFRNLSAKFFGELNSKIALDNYVYNELLRLS